jgi:hypothetical protein
MMLMLRWILDGMKWYKIDWSGLEQEQVEGPCEHGNEPSGSVECWEIRDWLRNWRLLKKGSAPAS